MCPALLRVINRLRGQQGQLPLAPHERAKAKLSELLTELTVLQGKAPLEKPSSSKTGAK